MYDSTPRRNRRIEPDKLAIVEAMRLILEPGQVTELRALEAILKGERRQGTVSGYFDDVEKLAQAVFRIASAKGIYFLPNPINPALLARAENRIRVCGKSDPLTSDHDVIKRRWLPIDVDPLRAAGISASDAEHNAALAVGRRIRDYLASESWPDPILADSSNGCHLLYRIDLAAIDGGLVERCLAAVDALFGDGTVTVDTSVFNPARIWKLYGTPGCKGDDTTERPHRPARILEAPTSFCTVPRDLLEALAAQAPAPANPPAPRSAHNGNSQPFDVERWIAEHVTVPVEGPEPWQGGRRWVFPVCPWNPDHTDRSAFLLQHQSGAVSAGCHHNGCNSNGWHELRYVFEPGWRDRKPERNGASTSNQARATTKAPAVKVEPYQPFPVEALPQTVAGFVTAGAKAIGCDASYIALPLLTALAAAIGNTRRLRIKSTWEAPPILWTAVVGESGTIKSPARDFALRPVYSAEKRARQQYEAELARHELALAEWERTRAELVSKNRGVEVPPRPAEPVARRYVVSDITVEAMATRLQDQPRGLLLAIDEFTTWLCSHDAYKSGRGGDTGHWLSMFDGREMIVDRKGNRRPIHVPNAGVCITGGIQPAVLERSLGRAHLENGLAARVLFAFPPRMPKKWTEADVDHDTQTRLESLFASLYALEFDNDDAEPAPKVLTFTPAGKRAWIDFFNEHNATMVELSGHLASAAAKIEGYTARLALIIHCIREAAGELSSDAQVDELSVKAAITLARWFGREAQRIYDLLRESDEQRNDRRLMDWIRARGGRATARDLQNGGLRDYRQPGVAQAALDGLVKSGVAIWEPQLPGSRGGKPTQVCVLLIGDETDALGPAHGDMSPMSPHEAVDRVTSGPDADTDDSFPG